VCVCVCVCVCVMRAANEHYDDAIFPENI